MTLTVTIVDNYASGNLTVAGSGVSSSPMTFTLSGAGSTTFVVNNAPDVIIAGGLTYTFMGTVPDSQSLVTSTDSNAAGPFTVTQTHNSHAKGRSPST